MSMFETIKSGLSSLKVFTPSAVADRLYEPVNSFGKSIETWGHLQRTGMFGPIANNDPASPSPADDGPHGFADQALGVAKQVGAGISLLGLCIPTFVLNVVSSPERRTPPSSDAS